MTGLLRIVEAMRGLREPAVLATLARARGSSYRRPGARMLFGAEGARSGTVSAGCLEADVLARAAAVLASDRPQLASYDMGSELDLIWGTGMGCGGRVEVLLERVVPGEPPPWMRLCAGLLGQRRRGVLATVFDARGVAKSHCPDRLLWAEGGECLLSPDRELSAVLARSARDVLARGLASSETVAVGGGEVDVLFEPVLAPFALWIYGAGEHARPIARMAKGLGWFVGIADHRPALATAERFPEADRILVGAPSEVLKDLPLDGRSAALVLSHVHVHDRDAVQALLPSAAAYLGLQGNRIRCERLVREIEAQLGGAIPAEQRVKLHHPAGLDLGAESPEAIALSMLSEIQAALSGRGGRSLRDGQGAIHSRPPVSHEVPMKKTVVVAIGGNSLILDGAHHSVPDQYRAAALTCSHIAAMLKETDVRLVVTHGNGPQVGFILRRSDLAAPAMHQVPLDSCVADTQGAIGYHLQRAMRNEFRRHGVEKCSAAVVTQVLVDANDPAFLKPNKPIGAFMSEEQAERHRVEDHWDVVEDAGRGWRRVVASPAPKAVLELGAVKSLLDAGFVVVAAGGGGIAVVEDSTGAVSGASAVIDKDLASSLLARQVGADILVISTGVEKVCLDYGKPTQRSLDSMSLADAKRYMAEGHFKPGSMLPKIQAVVEFLEGGGKMAIITDPEHLGAALKGQSGTRIE